MGYLSTVIDGKTYKLHRLAFLFMEGYHPEHDIDHLNGEPSDNRWMNLRHVTPSCNAQNRKINKRNTTGFPGVSKRENGISWMATAHYAEKSINLGLHKTSLDAALARFTWEVNCSKWTCNARSKLYLAIKTTWPEFNPFGDSTYEIPPQ